MIRRIIKSLKKNDVIHKSGTIRLEVNMIVERSLTFRVDAQNMQVVWGDGEISKRYYHTEQFVHEYKQNGVYEILISGENIEAIDMPGCYCSELDIQVKDSLEFINCSNNQLQQLRVNQCKHLNELHCDNNLLKQLELDELSELFHLSCSFNLLERISVKGCRNLVNLYCIRNKLRSLDLRNCCKLLIVNIGENEFDEIALLRFISTLRHKFNNKIGLLGINGILPENTEQIRISIAEKGWCEI